jgi:HPt (histidine-containing phosphotransfer) domain-containing protein
MHASCTDRSGASCVKSFEQLDMKAFDRYFSGMDHRLSVELYIKLGRLFHEGFATRISELTNALANQNPESARVVSHRLRGALLSLGGNQLGQKMHEIELGLGQKSDAELLSLLQGEETHFRKFLDELNEWMGTLQESLTSK